MGAEDAGLDADAVVLAACQTQEWDAVLLSAPTSAIRIARPRLFTMRTVSAAAMLVRKLKRRASRNPSCSSG